MKIQKIIDGRAYEKVVEYDINTEKNEKFTFISVGRLETVKNHKYLIDAFKNLTPSQKKNLKLIFTGHEKFNKKYIQEEINKSGLESHISIFEYINDKQLISLYLNATALVMPTFVGHSTLPLYEAFYFNLPVLFSKDLLDESLKKCVYEIDIFNPEDFANQLEKLLNDNWERT